MEVAEFGCYGKHLIWKQEGKATNLIIKLYSKDKFPLNTEITRGGLVTGGWGLKSYEASLLVRYTKREEDK
jgi:hypothetical protein